MARAYSGGVEASSRWLPTLTMLVGLLWLGLIVLALDLHARPSRVTAQTDTPPGQVTQNMVMPQCRTASGGPCPSAAHSLSVLRARPALLDRQALSYAKSVQQAMQAYLKDYPGTQRLTYSQQNCTQKDYHAGIHHAVGLNARIVSCNVTLSDSGGVRVNVIYMGGTHDTVRLGN